MAFSKKTVKDINIRNKRVLLRADYNIPIKADGKIADDYRIEQSIPTLRYLLDQGCKIIICSHLGRPSGKHDKHCSLRPVARRLQELVKTKVDFDDSVPGEELAKKTRSLKSGDILLLENLRFYPQEEENNQEFAKQLASLADVFVQDGFGVVHRSHASTDGVTKFLPSVSGLLLEKEIVAIGSVMNKPKHPLAAIIGGAKISDKLDVLNRLIDVADFVAVGGAMANTFLLAQGIKTGKSLTEPDDIPLAKDILEKAAKKSKRQPFVFYLPQDGVVASSMDKQAATRVVEWGGHVISDIEHYPRSAPPEASRVAGGELILDIGPFSGAFIAGGIQLASTVIWNGTMGVTETPAIRGHGPVGPFSHGTEMIVEALMGKFGNKPYSLVGGGDTVGYVEARNLTEVFGHVSTGGGATLELMSGKKLPGVEALQNKK